METIELSYEDYNFLLELQQELTTQDNDGNALIVEERSPVGSFVLHGQKTVASAWADDDSTAGSLLGIR